ncbi:MAG: alpha/beta hydrolase family protein [Thalassobaculales bacterium]
MTTGLVAESPALGRPIAYSFYAPAAPRPWPLVYLLHGLEGHERDWLEAGGLAATLDRAIADGMPPLAVAMPMAGNSWYVDSDAFGPVHRALATDLVAVVEARHQAGGCRQARAAGGLSMGGYGALLLAFARPERYAAAVSLSGSIFRPMPEDAAARAQRRVRMFGPAFGDPFDWRRFNAWNLFLKLPAVAGAAPRPAFWLHAGDDDFPGILDGTVALHLGLRQAGAESELRVTEGGHEWPVWARDIGPALHWLAGRLKGGCQSPPGT